MPILNAWHNATCVVENGYLNQHLSKAKQKINQGMRLSDALAEVPNLPSELGMLISIGESSGRLTSLLEKASLDLEQQLIDTTDNLGKLIEPFVILLLGGMVGTLVLSIYLPIFSLMNSLH
ncbi:type IV fimbrial assembly protein pilC [Vibrio sp. JCM 19236]|nr:type IV fimbrial assembly protein pilC [Vibrio sp. JCM 19236]